MEFSKEKPNSLSQVATLGLCRGLDFPCLLLFSRNLITSVATRFLAAALISGHDIACGRDLVGSMLLKS